MNCDARSRGTAAPWTEISAAAATGGHFTHPFSASGVSIDSRTSAPGDLFVALRGPNFDGHEYVADSFANGAAAAVVHESPKGTTVDAPLVVVRDTMDALNGLGAWARNSSTARVIAVTGSVGKTGIKEALKLVLSRQAPTSASAGSLNNHWGVPLSLARMSPMSAFGVFELGMNHAGEISPLSRMVRPHVAVVTNVAAVHRAFFASLTAIADAKAEVFDGLEADGIAVLNRDDPQFARLEAAARTRGVSRVVGFGACAKADVRLVEARPESEASAITAEVFGKRLEYRLGVPGSHWVVNSLAVLGAVHAAGTDVAAAARALADLAPLSGRGQRCRVFAPGGTFLVIDESYNASPASVEAALAVLGAAPTGPGGRRIAVLGDMLELGEETAALHAALAEPLERAGVDLVFAAGAAMGRLYDALPAAMRGASAAAATGISESVTAAVGDGDVIMVKGSAAMGMAGVVGSLLAAGDVAATTHRRAAKGR
ncbi:MAG: UDP-N-acetylmuramoyl-tripeptide--D-alanyl-D-alanine ligase [Rhodospirillales bacterium]|nr:UDP-N-acetylmuramoyl-tripeptide--D-alanyl-D-alanine ligase [Rhodospirillales bacterium]